MLFIVHHMGGSGECLQPPSRCQGQIHWETRMRHRQLPPSVRGQVCHLPGFDAFQYCAFTTHGLPMARILRSPFQQPNLECSNDADVPSSEQVQTLPCSPIAASLSEYREDFWEATITIPLHRALVELLYQDPSRQSPRCLRDPYPESPRLMSLTPESCAFTVSTGSPRSPSLPPQQKTPVINTFSTISAHRIPPPEIQLSDESKHPQGALMTSRKRGPEAFESTQSASPTRKKFRTEISRAVGKVMALSPNYTQEENDGDEEATTTHIPDTEKEKAWQDFSSWCAGRCNRQGTFPTSSCVKIASSMPTDMSSFLPIG
jgi:hypothetical protein